MYKFYFFSLLIVCTILNAQNIKAQDSTSVNKDSINLSTEDSISLMDFKDSIDNLISVKSYFMATLGYLSNNVYLGRKDSVATPYITPMFGYYHKSGLYINASVSYLPTAGQGRIDLFTIESGYTFKSGSLDCQVSASKFWYNSASYNVRSELKGSISFFSGYDFGFIKPTLMPTLNISNKIDFALTMGLEHTFYLDDGAFDITPTVNANASTENFYSSYYKVRRYSIKRKKTTTIVKGSVSGEVMDAGQFKIMDYEFTVPLNYTIKKFTLNFTPMLAIPVSPAVVTITTRIPNQAPKIKTFQEKLDTSFFFQGTLTYKF
jgi:hypothetical protein